MVGIFSIFSVSRSGHRRTQSGIDDRGALPPNTDFVASLNNLADSTHGIEVATEFEPLEHDQPIQCPLHSPSHPFLMMG
uniref:Uncharacterized protein n=1 Tax=Brassica oleracea TaxID=3712 RepID=A0A3P6BWR7_BRAOL|nr:unnamed protein product [Brassica oleracea]